MATGGYMKAADLPQVIPVFPLDRVLLLPHGVLPLNIFEPRYLNMVDDAMAGDRLIGMVQTRGVTPPAERARPRLAAIGCAGRITSYTETGDGRYLISLTGICRFGAGPELPVQTPYRQVRADFARFEQDLQAGETERATDRPGLLSALKAYLQRHGLEVDWRMAEDAPLEALINSLSMALPFEQAEKQALLEADTLDARREALTALLTIDAAVVDDEDGEPPSLQ